MQAPDPNPAFKVHYLESGADYLTTWQAMRQFTAERSDTTPDELWVVEHAPVFTLGQAGRVEHILGSPNHCTASGPNTPSTASLDSQNSNPSLLRVNEDYEYRRILSTDDVLGRALGGASEPSAQPSRAFQRQGARNTGTGVYSNVNEDSEYPATTYLGRAVGCAEGSIPLVPEGTVFASEDCGMQCKAQNLDGSLTPSRLCNAAMRPQDRSQDSIFGYEGYIPIVRSDRGGQVTYHGPGQVVIYLLINLRRHQLHIKPYVQRLEQIIIDFLVAQGLTQAQRKPGAPGVYIPWPLQTQESEPQLAKIAALGIKVSRGYAYHGLSVNVNMNLEPYQLINPCGFPGLQTIDLASCGVNLSWQNAAEQLVAYTTAAFLRPLHNLLRVPNTVSRGTRDPHYFE